MDSSRGLTVVVRPDVAADIAGRVRARSGDGDVDRLWLAFVAPDGSCVAVWEQSDGRATVDELFWRHVAATVALVGVPTVVAVVRAPTGVPQRRDRRLLTTMRSRLTGIAVGLLTVGTDAHSLSPPRIAMAAVAA